MSMQKSKFENFSILVPLLLLNHMEVGCGEREIASLICRRPGNDG